MKWSNIQIDHAKPNVSIDVSEDEKIKEAFSWKNTQPILKRTIFKKAKKNNLLFYRLQFVKANQFIKLNEE